MTMPKFRVWDKVKKHMSEVEAIVYTENKVQKIKFTPFIPKQCVDIYLSKKVYSCNQQVYLMKMVKRFLRVMF